MKTKFLKAVTLAAVSSLLVGFSSVAPAQAEDVGRLHLYQGSDDRIFGYQYMTDQEREVHQNRMHNARTWEERARIRAEHRALMLERAERHGHTLSPPYYRRGLGRHSGRHGWR
jgi:hypothetical protein